VYWLAWCGESGFDGANTKVGGDSVTTAKLLLQINTAAN
jgi:hypothetical protein